MIEYFEEGDDAFLFFMVLAKIRNRLPRGPNCEFILNSCGGQWWLLF